MLTHLDTQIHLDTCPNSKPAQRQRIITHKSTNKATCSRKNIHRECIRAAAGSARDAAAQWAWFQTLNSDHRQTGLCFILAREHFSLITPSLMLWSQSQVWVRISRDLAQYEWERRLWQTEPEWSQALDEDWSCKVAIQDRERTSPTAGARELCQQAEQLLYSGFQNGQWPISRWHLLMKHFYRITGRKRVCCDSLGGGCVYFSAVWWVCACLHEHIVFPCRSKHVCLNVIEWVCVFMRACVGECVNVRGNGCVWRWRTSPQGVLFLVFQAHSQWCPLWDLCRDIGER